MSLAIATALSVPHAPFGAPTGRQVLRARSRLQLNLQYLHQKLHRCTIIPRASADDALTSTAAPDVDFATAAKLPPSEVPDIEGVYAVYAPDGSLQVGGIKRRKLLEG